MQQGSAANSCTWGFFEAWAPVHLSISFHKSTTDIWGGGGWKQVSRTGVSVAQWCLSTFAADASLRSVFTKKSLLYHTELEQDFYMSGIARTETVPRSSSKFEHAVAAYRTITGFNSIIFYAFLPVLVVVSYRKQVMIY